MVRNFSVWRQWFTCGSEVTGQRLRQLIPIFVQIFIYSRVRAYRSGFVVLFPSYLSRTHQTFRYSVLLGTLRVGRTCVVSDTTDALPCRFRVPVRLWIMDPHSRAPKTNTSHGNEVLPQDTMRLIQRPCYQRGSPCQDPAGNCTTWRPDDRKETQTAVV